MKLFIGLTKRYAVKTAFGAVLTL